MENQKIRVELSRLCRTCTAERLHMSSLFARDSDVSRGLDYMLMLCTNLKILKADDLPNLICDQCVDQLKSAYRFQQRCETADRYYKRLRLKSNSDCIQTPTVFYKDPNYDYIEMLENNLIVFRCRECCHAFNTIRELKNHKQIHSKNEITEEKHESLSVTQLVDFTEEENKEEHLLEMNQEEEIDEVGDKDSNSSFFKKFDNRDTKENSEMDAMPMESEIKEEELLTFTDTVIKEEIEDNRKGEYNMSNLFLQQSYQNDTKKLVSLIDQDLNSTFLKKIDNRDTEENCEINAIPMESEIKKEELLTFTDTVIKEEIEDNRKGEYNMSNLFLQQSYQNDTKKLVSLIDQDVNSTFFKKIDNCVTEENCEINAIPMESEIKKEELLTFTDTVIKEEIKGNGKGEYNVSNICFKQSYQKDTKKLEVVAIQKIIEKENILELLKETDARLDNNVKSSSSDNQDEDYSPSNDSDSDYFPDQMHRINIGTKNQKHRNTRRKHRLAKKLNSPKTDCPRIFQCTDCGQKLDDSKALQDHCLLHSCRVYIQRLTCFNDPKGHLHSHDSEQRLTKCDIRYHEQEHNPNTGFKCDVCEKSFACRTYLRKHQLTHNASKPFKCDVCEKSFSCSSNFSRHKLTHNGSKPFKCDVCEKSFPSSSHLKTHKWMHNPNKRFKCDVCEKQFTYSNNLNNHKLTHNAVKRTHKRFKCNICEKLFARSSLRRHQLTHNAYKSFKCDMCDKSFSCSRYLCAHKLTHDPNKPLKCDMCEKSFSCRKYLRRHQLTHNTSKSFKCDVCEISFSCSSNFHRHKLTHNASKPFKCDMCEKSFSCSSNFHRHKLTHNASKPWKCDMCEKSFSCSSYLQDHKWSHNPNKHFKCNICEKLFTHSSSLRRHQFMTHDKPVKCNVLPDIIHIQQQPQGSQVDTHSK